MFKRRKAEELLPAHLALAEKPRTEGGPGPAANPGPGVSADSGLGVPPFRPATPKDAAMGRFTPIQPTPPPGLTPRPAVTPGLRPPARDPADCRTLVVGCGISVQGTVQDAERLVVEGTVEANMIRATELAIAPGGIFKGEVEVEKAEIAGTIDGTLTVRNSLVVRSTGRLLGMARCKRLQVEDGGEITGRMEMLSEPPRPASEPAS